MTLRVYSQKIVILTKKKLKIIVHDQALRVTNVQGRRG